MVELRKRAPPKETVDSAPPAKRGSGAGAKIKSLADKAKGAVVGGKTNEPTTSTSATTGTGDEANGTPTATTTAAAPASAPRSNSSSGTGKISTGSVVDLNGFGGQVQTNDGVDTNLKELVDKSSAGVVVFTYPKASTPGCTTQACLFRDSYTPITGASLSVYGLSTDSPKSNTTFVNKHSLPFPLLCDPNATLTTAIGMKKPGPGKSTSRGVVLIDKQGTVKLWEQAGPQRTLDAVLDYIKTQGMTETGGPTAVAAPPAEDPRATEEAAKLADPYAGVGDTKMDEVPLVKTPSKDEQEAAETAAEVGETAAKIDSNHAAKF